MTRIKLSWCPKWKLLSSLKQIFGILILFFQEPPKEDLTVSEKFQLVLDVAQKAQVKCDGQWEVYGHKWFFLTYLIIIVMSLQNLFGRMANILEKIKK